MSINDDEILKRPSYGMVQFSRVTGGNCRLFGSALTHVVQATGIEALREMRARGEVPTLPAHEETSK